MESVEFFVIVPVDPYDSVRVHSDGVSREHGSGRQVQVTSLIPATAVVLSTEIAVVGTFVEVDVNVIEDESCATPSCARTKLEIVTVRSMPPPTSLSLSTVSWIAFSTIATLNPDDTRGAPTYVSSSGPATFKDRAMTSPAAA
jgi:hypothetical protein